MQNCFGRCIKFGSHIVVICVFRKFDKIREFEGLKKLCHVLSYIEHRDVLKIILECVTNLALADDL